MPAMISITAEKVSQPDRLMKVTLLMHASRPASPWVPVRAVAPEAGCRGSCQPVTTSLS